MMNQIIKHVQIIHDIKNEFNNPLYLDLEITLRIDVEYHIYSWHSRYFIRYASN